MENNMTKKETEKYFGQPAIDRFKLNETESKRAYELLKKKTLSSKAVNKQIAKSADFFRNLNLTHA